jgi:hypothetical protein
MKLATTLAAASMLAMAATGALAQGTLAGR